MSEWTPGHRTASDFLQAMADKYSEGFHDGMEIDAGEVVDLGRAADLIARLEAELRELEEKLKQTRGWV